MAVKTTQDKFMHEIGDIYDAESQFLKSMGQMVEKTSDKTLQTMITDHLQQTQGHIRNLEQVYSLMGQQPKRVRRSCAARPGRRRGGRPGDGGPRAPGHRDRMGARRAPCPRLVFSRPMQYVRGS